MDATSTDPAFEERVKELTGKGELDLRNAVMSLIHVQSAVFVYAISETIAQVIGNFVEFQKEIKNIDSASSAIRDIASKTRMLSINAAIEAAHAGIEGKGFGVVAKEIGTLSAATAKCNDEVNEVNKNMLATASKSHETLDIMENYLPRFAKTNDKVMADILKIAAIEDNGFIVTTLAKRLENHADFMRNVLTHPGTLKNMSDHHSCAFGKWYDQNRERYKNMPGYEAVYETHKEFHSIAIRFNKTMDVSLLIVFLELSSEILSKFLTLIESFKAETQKDIGYFKV